jgi:hypothetical protein
LISCGRSGRVWTCFMWVVMGSWNSCEILGWVLQESKGCQNSSLGCSRGCTSWRTWLLVQRVQKR